MFVVTTSGSFNKTREMLKAASREGDIRSILERGGLEGVMALRLATPINSGETSAAWDYEVIKTKRGYQLWFTNSVLENGFPVAVMIQYGHGTGNGGYVSGIDYINPALQPVFDKVSDELGRVVK